VTEEFLKYCDQDKLIFKVYGLPDVKADAQKPVAKKQK